MKTMQNAELENSGATAKLRVALVKIVGMQSILCVCVLVDSLSR
jgi:hypothetical protein